MSRLLSACLGALLLAAPAALAQRLPPVKVPVPIADPVTLSAAVTHPAWAVRGNVYEVNLRQYTPEGTLNAFAKHLDRLQKMGVQTLWFMPLNPISKLDRKGTLGSYYAVSDYTKLNPEFGTMADWNRLVEDAHKRGMKVLIDWVPNHAGADHPWVTQHPEFFVQKDGKPAVPFDWTDTRQLDYKNLVMQDSMIAAMRYWVQRTHIDGFRCDVAWNVPASFWRRCITQLRQDDQNLFMLAEGDSTYLPRAGFDAVYPWRMFKTMIRVAKGAPVTILDSLYQVQHKDYLPGTLQLYFTSNHDENSWNKSDYGTFPGAVHAPFAIFTQTMPDGLPLIYSGQEEPVLRPLQFFEKDPIEFAKYERAAFYQTLLALRRRTPALDADATFRRLPKAGAERAVYAYVREKAGRKVLVLLNLSDKPQAVTVPEKALQRTARNVFSGKDETLTAKPQQLAAWGYRVYEYGAGSKLLRKPAPRAAK